MSRNIEATDPGFALTLNPANSEAAVNLVVGALNRPEVPDLTQLADVAARMLTASPADARGYSILGAVEERKGDVERGQALYQVALEHSKSELHALLRTAQARLQEADTAGSLENIDLLLRRWPSYWEQVEPILLVAASNQEAAVLLQDKLNEMPPWRGRAVAALARDPAALGVLRNLISSSPDDVRTKPTWIAERDTVIAALVGNKAFTEAYGLFLSTMTEQEAEASAYVFDGAFKLPLSRTYFGWRAQKPGATEVRLGEEADEGLRVRFLDSPARPGIVSQNTVLPFGRYRLSVQASATALNAPKELFWSIRCGGGAVLATLDVPPGTFSGTQLQAELEVPATGCPMQVISLDTEVRTESWRDRYQGEVKFDNLALTRL